MFVVIFWAELLLRSFIFLTAEMIGALSSRDVTKLVQETTL